MAATATVKHGLLSIRFRPFLQSEGVVGIQMDVMDSVLGINIQDRSMFTRWDTVDFGDGATDYQVQDFYAESMIAHQYDNPTSEPVMIKHSAKFNDGHIIEAVTGPHYMYPSRIGTS